MKAIDHGHPGTVLNIGGGQEISLLDAIGLLGESLGIRPKIHFRPPRAGDQRRTLANTSKAREILGWRPVVEPKEGLRCQAEWVRSVSG